MKIIQFTKFETISSINQHLEKLVRCVDTVPVCRLDEGRKSYLWSTISSSWSPGVCNSLNTTRHASKAWAAGAGRPLWPDFTKKFTSERFFRWPCYTIHVSLPTFLQNDKFQSTKSRRVSSSTSSSALSLDRITYRLFECCHCTARPISISSLPIFPRSHVSCTRVFINRWNFRVPSDVEVQEFWVSKVRSGSFFVYEESHWRGAALVVSFVAIERDEIKIQCPQSVLLRNVNSSLLRRFIWMFDFTFIN